MVEEYSAFWLREPALRQRMEVTWQYHLKRMSQAPPRRRWAEVRGPIAATIATLLDVDWVPRSSTEWEHPNGEVWECLEGPRDAAAVRAEFEETVRTQQWRRASKSHNGTGLEDGCDFSVAKASISKLRAKGDHKSAGLMRCAACAGIWTKQRLLDANYVVDDVSCPLCDDGPDTDFHRIWQCEAVAEAGLDEVKKSQHLKQRAEGEVSTAPCFWLRGLVPKAWTALPPPRKVELVGTGLFAGLERSEPLNIEGLDVYLDESGGEFSSDIRRRRCGWGLAIIREQDGDFVLTGGVAGTLEDVQQTSNRAAVEALVFVLRFTRGHGTVKPDSKYLVDGFNGGRYRRPDGRNADLWSLVAEALDARDTGIEVVKVRAHIDQEEAMGLDAEAWRDVIGNMYADGYAGQAAARARPHGTDDDLRVKAWDCRATKVLDRIVAVHRFAFGILEKQGRTHDFPRMAQPDTLLQRLGARSNHAFDCTKESFRFLKRLPGKIGCHKSGMVVSRRGVKDWLRQGVCPGLPLVAWLPDQPRVCNSTATARVGRRGVHQSHSLTHYRGVWWCARCGSYSSMGADTNSKVRGLARPCRGGCTTMGASVLRRLRSGRTPIAGMLWPLGPDDLDVERDVSDALPCTRLRTKTTITLADVPTARRTNPLDDPEGTDVSEDDLGDQW
jgi:ribonuclease HI